MFCINNTSEPQDWRHYSNLSSEYSNAYEDFEDADGNFKVKEGKGGTYDIYISKSNANPENVFINAHSSGETPEHVAPFFQFKEAAGEWQYLPLGEDPNDDSQYKVASVVLSEGDEFVFCIDNTSEPQDWRHYSNLSSEYSNAYEDFEDAEGNFKVKEGKSGTYDIYISKSNAEEKSVFINKQGGEPEPPQPEHAAPFMQLKAEGGEWEYTALLEDEEDNTQYKVAEIELEEGDEFVFCIDNTSEPQDWRHFDNMSETFSDAYADFEDADGNFKVKEGKGGTYDIYISKSNANPENVFINAHSSGETPEHVAPFFQFKEAAGEWQYLPLGEDPNDDSQYKVASVVLSEGDEFVFCIDNTSEPQDWRHYSNLSSEYSNAYEDFEDAEGNFKVKEGKSGTYDIYISKSNAEEKSVFINKQGESPEPEHNAPFFQFKEAGGEWQYLPLGEDPENNSQYKVASVVLSEGDEFVFCIDNTNEPQDWRHFANMSETYSDAYADFEDADGNFKVKEGKGGTYDIYISKSNANNENVFINAHSSGETPDPQPVNNVDYVIHNTNDWDASSGEFYAWVWGENNSGRWVALPAMNAETKNIEITLPSSETGMKILRFSTEATVKPVAGSTEYGSYAKTATELWNESGNINLTGVSGTINFAFPD